MIFEVLLTLLLDLPLLLIFMPQTLLVVIKVTRNGSQWNVLPDENPVS